VVGAGVPGSRRPTDDVVQAAPADEGVDEPVAAAVRIVFAIHSMMNPNIEVADDRAAGVWQLFRARTFAEGHTPVWGAARYDVEHVRGPDGWKIRRLRLISSFWTPFDHGWVERPLEHDP
jgi:hypothetical protein